MGVVGLAGAAGVALGSDARNADVHERRRADFPEQVRVVPSPRFDRADVPDHLRRGTAVGALDSRARRVAQHAALAHRQDASASSTTRMTARSATRKSTPSSTGSPPARRRATPRTCPPPVKWADGNGWNYAKQFGGPPDLDHQVAQVHAEGRRDGRVVQAGRRDGPDRAPLGPRHRDAPGHAEGPQDHASRARLPDAGREGSPGHVEQRRTPTAAPASSWNGPSTSRAS